MRLVGAVGLCAGLRVGGWPGSKCGSGLARECGGSVDGDVGCHDAFASKPAPTGLVGGLKIGGWSVPWGYVADSGLTAGGDPNVGAGLLANAVGQAR